MILEIILTLAVMIAGAYIFMSFWDKFSVRRLRKKYVEKEDKSKQGELRGGFSRGEGQSFGSITKAEPGDAGLTQSAARQLLPTTSTKLDGKDSNSLGETKPRRRNPFRRRK